ncbi:UNKNOWN [Stylonychia lemnae]|uniref:FCP1 homology domain-containing protein n=1 Tax=Stylonychia lemnae TaxID=5949 RepID=A0A078AHY3_STYLE|nr:UNKNOWN [Stylonychia lemnae]|eukprot:CDW81122.1 UNKNOWN [Stylonychia lemnae]
MESSKIQANFLLAGEKGSEGQKILTVQVNRNILAKIDEFYSIFNSAFLTKVTNSAETNQLWFDFRDVYADHKDIENDVEILLAFINKYEVQVDRQAKVFTGVESFNRFKKLAELLTMHKSLNFVEIKKEVFKQHPVLLLCDIGGSILYRCSERLADLDRKVDFQIKKHIHYYRPHKDEFLAALITHPRVKFGIYSSIMRKNIMPLMMKIFESREIKNLRNGIYEIFDQEYNMPDLGEGKEHWATKRSLEKVFQNEKIEERGFNFKNTLMIDSEYDKVRDYPFNSIVIEPYSEEALRNPADDQSKNILIEVKDFVYNLLENTDDVPEYLKVHTKYGHENYLIEKKSKLQSKVVDTEENKGLDKELKQLQEIQELIKQTEDKLNLQE